jgi:(2Fe-2S) ferredoxin
MTKPEKHILVCGGFRAGGDAQGVCGKKGSVGLLPYLEEELRDRDIEGVMISATTCLKVCDRGPALVIYPDNTWYAGINGEEEVNAILDAWEEGGVAEDLMMT